MKATKYKVPREIKRSNRVRRASLSPSFVNGKILPSEEQPPIIRALQNGSNTVSLGLSGKDSLAAYLFLRDHGFDVAVYCMWQIPNLPSDLMAIDYYERKFGIKIIQYPHPNYYTSMSNLDYQPPHRVGTIRSLAMDDHQYFYREVEEQLEEALSLPRNTYAAIGIRAADSAGRGFIIRKNGTIGVKHRYWNCVWDWTLDDVIDRIKKENLLLHPHYEFLGGTGDFWTYNSMKIIHDHYPDDWKVIKEAYPLIDMMFFRFERLR